MQGAQCRVTAALTIRGPTDAAVVLAVFFGVRAYSHRRLVSSRDDALPMLLGLVPVRGKPQHIRESDSDGAEKTLGV